MGKTEEYLAKKRNKAVRRRLSNTIDFTHGVQAAKRRRKAGRRRACEGMCYSLPTPEDPFNDSYKESLAKKKAKKASGEEDFDLPNGKRASKVGLNRGKAVRPKESKANGKSSSAESNKFEKTGGNTLSKISKAEMPLALVIQSGSSNHALSNVQYDPFPGQTTNLAKYKWKPSCENCSNTNNTWTCVGGDAFEVALCALLNANMVKNENYEISAVEQKVPFEKCIGSKWDWLFWEACGTGSDVLVTWRDANTITQRNSVLAAVAHIGARRAPQTRFKDPIVLFLVQSKEHTLKVRSIFKVFKSFLGLHALSLHPQTALEHQIKGLKSTEAEVLVATPGRLCELLSMNAVSLTNISFMVVDGVEEMVSCGFGNDLLHIKGRVADNVQAILSSGHFPPSTHHICQTLLKDPIRRVISNISLPQTCACIRQSVLVLVSEDKRQHKLRNILKNHTEDRENGASSQGLVVLCRRLQSLLQVKDMIQEEGYSVDVLCDDNMKTNQSASLVLEHLRDGQVEVLLAAEDCVSQIDLAEVGIVVLYEFTASMEFYRQIVTRMARNTINGVLYSFCSGATAPLASQLIDVLQECLQPIPSSLRMLADAAQVLVQRKGS